MRTRGGGLNYALPITYHRIYLYMMYGPIAPKYMISPCAAWANYPRVLGWTHKGWSILLSLAQMLYSYIGEIFFIGGGVYEKIYEAFTERGVYKNLLPGGGGSTKIYRWRRGGLRKISEFCRISTHPPPPILNEHSLILEITPLKFLLITSHRLISCLWVYLARIWACVALLLIFIKLSTHSFYSTQLLTGVIVSFDSPSQTDRHTDLDFSMDVKWKEI